MKMILSKIHKKLIVPKGHRQKGQTLIEFLLMLITLVFLATFLLQVVNGHIATRWKGFVRIIANPIDQKIDF